MRSKYVETGNEALYHFHMNRLRQLRSTGPELLDMLRDDRLRKALYLDDAHPLMVHLKDRVYRRVERRRSVSLPHHRRR